MKKIIIGMTCFLSTLLLATAHAEEISAMQGSGKDLTKCVANVIGTAIQKELNEKSDLLILTTPYMTETKTFQSCAPYGDRFTRATEKVYPTFEELNYTMDPAHIAIDWVYSKTGIQYWVKSQNYGRECGYGRDLTQVNSTPVIFQFTVQTQGQEKYHGATRLLEFTREYDNNGAIKKATCTLQYAKVLSTNTNAVLLTSFR